jgi:hypothetical protein
MVEACMDEVARQCDHVALQAPTQFDRLPKVGDRDAIAEVKIRQVQDP